MKRILTLLIVLGALVGVTYLVKGSRDKKLTSASLKGVEMREKLLPDLDMNSIKKIHIKDGKDETTVALTGDQWTLAERGGYPASFDKISRVVMEMHDQKISRKQVVGKTAWSEIKVLAPGEGDAAGAGTLVELADASGKVMRSFIIGEEVKSSGSNSQSPFGPSTNERFVRVPEDQDTVWVVSNAFSELVAKPDDWVEKSFIDVQKVKTVDVTQPNAADSWKASRKDESGTDFDLDGAKPGESLDNGKVALASLLASPTFNDVQSKEKAGADFMKGATKAKVETFDGFTYEVQALKKPGATPSDEKYYVTVAVSASLPKERTPGKDEKPEDKKKKDEEFASNKKTLEEKLAKEKKFEGWIFEVSSYTINALFKKRSEILKEPEKKEAAPAPPAAPSAPNPAIPAPAAAPAPMLPKPAPTPAPAKPAAAPATVPSAGKPAPISVTTPPVAVPPLPKTEIKPAPAPNANPAAPDKPVPPPASPTKPAEAPKKP